MSDAVPQAVGIDVGGTKIVALRVTSEGKELARSVRPTPADDMDATLATLVAALGDVSGPEVAAVDCSLPARWVLRERAQRVEEPDEDRELCQER